MIAPMVLTVALLLAPTGHSEQAPQVVVGKTASQTGVKDSAYKGKFYRKTQEKFRRCIAQREGRGQYWVTGNNGRYESTYQMTDALVRGAAWMMTEELKAMYPSEWKLVRNTLLRTPGHRWNRVYMDMAWWTVMNWRGDGAGAHHWAGGRYSCRLA